MADPPDQPSKRLGVLDIGAFKQRLSDAGFDTVSARTRADGTITFAMPNTLADIDALPVLTTVGVGRNLLSVGAPFTSGGMGMICRGRQTPLLRDVAVKVVAKKIEGSQSEARELLYEGRVTGMLEHPNIVPVYELGRDDGGDVLLVMKHVQGTAWSRMFSGPQSGEALQRHLAILNDVCRAVEFAHSRSILHRDLKPDNVMVGSFGEVYVLDWGLAMSLDDQLSAERGLPPARGARSIAGTPGYLAPEMVLPEGGLDERTDIFLLGAVLHQLVTGQVRWRGKDPILRFHETWICEPFAYDDAVPAELRAILARSMAREPAARFQRVSEFREAVSEFVKHEGARRLALEAAARCARLTSLAAGREHDAEAERLFTEARFGFQQALDVWPASPDAHGGLRQATLAMLRRAIARGAMEDVERHLRDVSGQVEPDLRGAIDALRERRRHEVNEIERLKEFEKEQRVGAGRTERGIVIAGIGVLWIVSGWLAATLLPLHLQLPLLAVVGLFAGVAVVAAQVRRSRRNRSNNFDRFSSRDTAAHAIVGALAMGVCAWMELPQYVGLSFMHILLAMTQLTLVLAFDRRTWLSAVMALCSAVPVVLWRDHALLASAFAGGLTLVFTGGQLWWFGTRDRALLA